MRYGGKFSLLVEEGTTLPSNLHGLYEVRYQGKELDNPLHHEAVLKALNDFQELDRRTDWTASGPWRPPLYPINGGHRRATPETNFPLCQEEPNSAPLSGTEKCAT